MPSLKKRRRRSAGVVKVAPMRTKQCLSKVKTRGPHQQARSLLSSRLLNSPPSVLKINSKNIKRIFVPPADKAFLVRLVNSLCCVEVDWKNDAAPKLRPPQNAQMVIPFDNTTFKVVDCQEECASIAVFGKKNGSRGLNDFLFYKASNRQRAELKHVWPKIRRLMPQAMKRKPNVARGKQSGAVCKRYLCYGHRKDPKGTGLGEYAFKALGKQDNHHSDTKVADSFKKVSGALEQVTNRFGHQLCEAQLMDEIRHSIGLPSFCNRAKATQFSVGLEYWSVAHRDDDYYHTTLSCLSNKGTDHDKTLYYFMFPCYKIAVPLKSGDVLFFNPTELHCCSNPSSEQAVIFSSYVSAKTCNTQCAAKKSC